MNTLTPTDTASAAALPAAATVGSATADPLAALLSFAEALLARQQPAPSAQPAAPVTEAETAPDPVDEAPDLASTLPQALAVALQLQPAAAAPVALPAKARAADEHEDAPVPLPVPVPVPQPVLMSALAPLTAAVPMPTVTPSPVAQDPAPAAAGKTAQSQASASAALPAIEAKVFAADTGSGSGSDLDTRTALKDDNDATAAPALPILAGNDAAGSADAKFSLPQAAPALRLPHGDAQQWQSPLMQALGDRIQLQLATKSDAATIRLEPPQMGRVDIAIRQDAAGSLQVNLSATHGEVVHQLQQISEGMRWNLAQQRQGGEVVVQVSAAAPEAGAAGTGRGGDGSAPRQPWQRDEDSQRPGRALSASDESPSSFALS